MKDVFFSLERTDHLKGEAFNQELFFLRITQKLLSLFHSGLSSDELLRNLQDELKTRGINTAGYGPANAGLACISLREPGKQLEFWNESGSGIEIRPVLLTFQFLSLAREAEECLEELQENFRYGDFEKIFNFSPIIILEQLLDTACEFMSEMPEINQGFFVFVNFSGEPLVKNVNFPGMAQEPLETLVERMKGRTFFPIARDEFDELLPADFSDNQLLGINLRNVSPFVFQGVFSLNHEIAGIDYEVLRLKRELLELCFSSLSKLLSRLKRNELLKLFYYIADALSFSRNFQDSMRQVVEACRESLSLKEFFFLFQPGEYPGQCFGQSLIDLSKLADNIAWDRMKNVLTMSSIIRDYTPFSEEERQVLKRLYFFPLTLRGQVQGIAVFSRHPEHLGFSMEDVELVKMVFLIITQNVLFHFQSARIGELNRLASLGQMAATIAHEVRNPLGGISLLATYLEGSLSDPSQKKMSGDIKNAVRSVDTLITDFLNFSRSETLNLGYFALRGLVEEVLGTLLLEFKQKGISIQKRFVEMPQLQIDGEKVKQVLLNILLNALEACPAGGCVTVETGIGTEAFFEVRNDGEQIPEERLSKIFEPFFTTKTRGSGLGLAVSRKIVELHAGRIDARNLGNGVAFRVFLPLERKSKP
ncbi:MAG: ATP-binding protein [Candidatus Wallbacteria bacterium]|nr:ATP-binding protein [Candidatus Wallbacteria bacterium]